MQASKKIINEYGFPNRTLGVQFSLGKLLTGRGGKSVH